MWDHNRNSPVVSHVVTSHHVSCCILCPVLLCLPSCLYSSLLFLLWSLVSHCVSHPVSCCVPSLSSCLSLYLIPRFVSLVLPCLLCLRPEGQQCFLQLQHWTAQWVNVAYSRHNSSHSWLSGPLSENCGMNVHVHSQSNIKKTKTLDTYCTETLTLSGFDESTVTEGSEEDRLSNLSSSASVGYLHSVLRWWQRW